MRNSKKINIYSGSRVNAESLYYYLSGGGLPPNNSTEYTKSTEYMCVEIPARALSLASWVNRE